MEPVEPRMAIFFTVGIVAEERFGGAGELVARCARFQRGQAFANVDRVIELLGKVLNGLGLLLILQPHFVAQTADLVAK